MRGRSPAATSSPVSRCWSLSPNRPVFEEIAGAVSRCWPGFAPLRPAMAVRSCAGFAARHAPGRCKRRCGGFCFGGASWVSPGTTGAFLDSVFVHGCCCWTSCISQAAVGTGMGICSGVTALGLKTQEWPWWEQGCVAGCALAGAGGVALLVSAAAAHKQHRPVTPGCRVRGSSGHAHA